MIENMCQYTLEDNHILRNLNLFSLSRIHVIFHSSFDFLNSFTQTHAGLCFSFMHTHKCIRICKKLWKLLSRERNLICSENLNWHLPVSLGSCDNNSNFRTRMRTCDLKVLHSG